MIDERSLDAACEAYWNNSDNAEDYDGRCWRDADPGLRYELMTDMRRALEAYEAAEGRRRVEELG